MQRRHPPARPHRFCIDSSGCTFYDILIKTKTYLGEQLFANLMPQTLIKEAAQEAAVIVQRLKADLLWQCMHKPSAVLAGRRRYASRTDRFLALHVLTCLPPLLHLGMKLVRFGHDCRSHQNRKTSALREHWRVCRTPWWKGF